MGTAAAEICEVMLMFVPVIVMGAVLKFATPQFSVKRNTYWQVSGCRCESTIRLLSKI
jgi:hypothetical protein